jgi:hypothetical protein
MAQRTDYPALVAIEHLASQKAVQTRMDRALDPVQATERSKPFRIEDIALRAPLSHLGHAVVVGTDCTRILSA